MLKEKLEIEKGGKEVIEVFPIKLWERQWKMSTSKHCISKVHGRRERSEDTCEEGCPRAFSRLVHHAVLLLWDHRRSQETSLQSFSSES